MSFSQAVSGLNAASNNLDVIGNNIANSATVGFKASNISFADMYAGSNVGLGTRVASVLQDFTNGSINSTSRALDVAINGSGFYRLLNGNGSVVYSRNGQFTLDSSRNIVNAQGLQLTGFPATGTPPAIQSGADPVGLSIPENTMSAKATNIASIIANLNSSDSTNTWNATDPTNTSNYKGSITTYDSLGNAHNFALYFVKTAANNWDVYAQDTSITGAGFQGPTRLTFDTSGALVPTPPATAVTPVTLSMASLNGSAASTFTLAFTGSVQQNSGSNSTKTPTQDGYEPGELTGYSISNDGSVIGSYSNKRTQLLGQIVLANFANPEGLSPQGDNVWAATNNSGQAVVGSAGTGNFGNLVGKATESSNVDMSKELVNMIVAQRNYQSNAQTIKTQDQILNTLVNLR
ncbi:flagellar basal body FlaE domain protein [Dickeya chrysanthemi Ech1591]|uniref:Flagellar hook protein FlgE n=1 Tax=Dickeya chrysanthemi (strain Ech1591) TaxID=561229 RepID=C6CF59_DICC1|nr:MULTISPECIES: flagellar hook protein FlgE [Dickeya]ACT06410.1 flagellar basal body FlaE domain protein [Dickeya chrysanthemi Ech1591]TYL43523.1 flagellar hook protein FlgE [Dickeya sp. ws52]WJM86100.1 flagellar hook protein FlgE [Dickeya chrysanthemi]